MVTFDRHALRAAREAAHLSRTALASRAGVRAPLIERAEMGTHREPFGSSLAAIADALNVDMRRFYTPAAVEDWTHGDIMPGHPAYRGADA